MWSDNQNNMALKNNRAEQNFGEQFSYSYAFLTLSWIYKIKGKIQKVFLFDAWKAHLNAC